MGIKKLFFESVLILMLVMLAVVTINSLQIHRNTSEDLKFLQKEYLNATFGIYKNELIGDILINNSDIIKNLLTEITRERGVGALLNYNGQEISAGKLNRQSVIMTYVLNLGNKKFATIKLYPLKDLQVSNFIETLLIPLILEILVLFIGFLWLLRRIKQKLLNPLNKLVYHLESNNIEYFIPQNESVFEIKQLSETLKKMAVDLKKKAQFEAESIAAKQVAHDIRSPLACLNLMLSYTTSLPEKQRILMRSSIQRITDIANLLQTKASKPTFLSNTESSRENVMLSSLIELLVTEKRMQLGLTTNVHIDLNLDNAYGLFSNINPIEFKRILSNLIDNSIEAFDNNFHQINIFIESDKEKIIIRIEDDGKGIPKNILDKVGSYGFSYGKDLLKNSGSGLGVHHAIKTVDSFGGSLRIQSTIQQGTTVTIVLPKAEPPEWFVNKILLDEVKIITILDDDESIHNLWKDRLEQLKLKYNFVIKHFTSVNAFEEFFQSNLELSLVNSLFLVDYEFVGQNTNGLNVIEAFQLSGHAILVTSHQDDHGIRTKAKDLNVKIIPKGIVPFVPLL